MSDKPLDSLLSNGTDVSFSDIEATLARLVRDRRRKRAPSRALTATVIVVGPPDRLGPCADAMEQLGASSGVRSIFITEGAQHAPTARVTETSILIAGLAPQFVNNAVAALRLSSLPALVWWRGGPSDLLPDLADLADRMVLDTETSAEVWPHAGDLIDHTALTDLRWTRLTRWRALLAHMFDLPQVRRAAATIASLTISAADVAAAQLFAGWLRASLRWTPAVTITITSAPTPDKQPLERAVLAGPDLTITLQVRSNRTCLEAVTTGVEASTRIVPCAEPTLASLLNEELSIRTRDLAFEQALAFAKEMH